MLYEVITTAKNWLEENGMEAMDGPVNFDEISNVFVLVLKSEMFKRIAGFFRNPVSYFPETIRQIGSGNIKRITVLFVISSKSVIFKKLKIVRNNFV